MKRKYILLEHERDELLQRERWVFLCGLEYNDSEGEAAR
jgi:hypothetical protein